ncbi:hypothetical protein EKO04_001459 [Ascochyta lentis]|uniref:N-acetyltransferase domain-containing protein n=1 Tax=Ascochyta lentis TaxID=205686 RepID=A0A8H7JAG4_9PLEO|nr:hypothetical protein EKO04_001459 [Ascochyta lentis]
MGFVVLPALIADISAVYDVYFEAFKGHPITRALFPSATEEDLTNPESEFRCGHLQLRLCFRIPVANRITVRLILPMYCSTGKIVGMALWDVYLTPSTWKKGEIGWLQGKERERAEAMIGLLWDAREKMWSNERYLYCHLVAVRPDSQRRGIGELLVEYGKKIATQAHLPIYTESSRAAIKLYENSGFSWLKERLIHKPENLLPGMADSRPEDREVPLCVWLPGGDERLLPKGVELA